MQISLYYSNLCCDPSELHVLQLPNTEHPYKGITVFYAQYCSLPFVGQLSCSEVKRLIRSMDLKNKSLVELKFVFVNKYSLGTLFTFEDSLNINMKSHLMYGLNCIDCTASYIGVITRVLPAR